MARSEKQILDPEASNARMELPKPAAPPVPTGATVGPPPDPTMSEVTGAWADQFWNSPWGGQEIYDTTYADFNRREAEALAAAQGHPANAMMLELAQGRGAAIEAANAQLRAGLDAANAAAASQAASARGGAGARALASRGAAMSAAQAGQRAANEASAMRAQMALGGLEGIARQRAEDMQMRTNMANTGAGIGQTGMQGAGAHGTAKMGAVTNLLGIASGHELGVQDALLRKYGIDVQKYGIDAAAEQGASRDSETSGAQASNAITGGFQAGVTSSSLLPRKPYGEE